MKTHTTLKSSCFIFIDKVFIKNAHIGMYINVQHFLSTFSYDFFTWIGWIIQLYLCYFTFKGFCKQLCYESFVHTLIWRITALFFTISLILFVQQISSYYLVINILSHYSLRLIFIRFIRLLFAVRTHICLPGRLLSLLSTIINNSKNIT